MARSRKTVKKKQHEPDPVYGNRLLTRFINHMMRDGKKSVAQHEVYEALELIKTQGGDPIKSFEQALNMVGPRMEVRPRRVGGASYQVPSEVRGDRRISLAIRWIIEAANKRSNKEFKTFAQKLAAEISDILKNQGEAVRKRDTVHRIAEANRAFAHFRW
ncbi:30S ribosomal protein S7 [Candidatus Gottesmanbacteria bacterium]|nr:30S ribosomal protein S7 [Candidatus Gottesmanbacteria bacterium]